MATFYGQTDKTLRIQLQSYLLEVLWGYAECATGGVVPIEARTAYVADGSKIMITVKDMNGGTVETIKGKVYSNFFRKQYKVKPNKTGGLFFEADMRAHGLRLVSQAMKVLPPVGISGFKFEDEYGNAIREVEDGQDITLSADVKGPPDGTKALINLYALPEKYSKTLVVSATTQVKSGKVSAIWRHQYPGDQEQKTVQADLNRTGEKYFAPKYIFEIDCLGTKVQSPHVGYAGSLTLNFPNIRGKVTYVLPDGTETTETIPDDGVLKIKSPKVGRVKIKDIEEKKGAISGSGSGTNPKGEGVKEIILGADEIKEKKAAKKPLLEVVTGQVANITVQRSVQILEMEDALFRHNSAVFLPSGTLDNATQQQVNVNGLDIIRAVYKYLEKDENKNKKLFIAGHTDTSGNENYNFKLSKLRALAVQYVLTGDREAWADQYKERQKNGVQTYRDEDIQHILKWTNIVRGWPCDPGPVDGVIGSNTKTAIKMFQESHNKDFGKSITVNGLLGKQTWGAVFDVYQDKLAAKMETDSSGLAAYQRRLKWANSDDKSKSTVGCGETFPIDMEEKDNYRSKINRRVEILLFDEEDLPSELCMDNSCTEENCSINKKRFIKKVYIHPPEINFGCIGVRLYGPTHLPLVNITCELKSSCFPVTQQRTSKTGEINFSDIPLCPPFMIKLQVERRSLELDIPWLRDSSTLHDIVVIDCNQLLGPKDDEFGIQARLLSLGYDCGPLDGIIGPKTKDAVTNFQKDQELEVDGIPGPITQDVLYSFVGA